MRIKRWKIKKKILTFVIIENPIIQIHSIHLNSVFWSQISLFSIWSAIDHNRARTFLHFQTRITRAYMIIHWHIHWLWQILGKHVKWGLSKQYCGYRERLGWRGARSVAYNPFPVGRPHPEHSGDMLITRATMQKECTDYAWWHFWTLSNWVDVAHDEFVKRFSYSDKSDRSIFEFELFRIVSANNWNVNRSVLISDRR